MSDSNKNNKKEEKKEIPCITNDGLPPPMSRIQKPQPQQPSPKSPPQPKGKEGNK